LFSAESPASAAAKFADRDNPAPRAARRRAPLLMGSEFEGSGPDARDMRTFAPPKSIGDLGAECGSAGLLLLLHTAALLAAAAAATGRVAGLDAPELEESWRESESEPTWELAWEPIEERSGCFLCV